MTSWSTSEKKLWTCESKSWRANTDLRKTTTRRRGGEFSEVSTNFAGPKRPCTRTQSSKRRGGLPAMSTVRRIRRSGITRPCITSLGTVDTGSQTRSSLRRLRASEVNRRPTERCPHFRETLCRSYSRMTVVPLGTESEVRPLSDRLLLPQTHRSLDLKHHFLPILGMLNRQLRRGEHQSRGVVFLSIHLVADDRPPAFTELNADPDACGLSAKPP